MAEVLVLVELFRVFFVIGLFTIGGGYAMLSLIQSEVVVNHGWISESAFTDIVAVSQMTPGPIGINCATYVGYDVMHCLGADPLLCFFGSLTATVAVVLPSFLIMLAIVKFYTRFRESRTFAKVMDCLRPAVVGLIGAAAVILILSFDWAGTPLMSKLDVSVVEENFQDRKSVV